MKQFCTTGVWGRVKMKGQRVSIPRDWFLLRQPEGLHPKGPVETRGGVSAAILGSGNSNSELERRTLYSRLQVIPRSFWAFKMKAVGGCHLGRVLLA